jgi:CubicO group peptidase (beta-lactamase class C family)
VCVLVEFCDHSLRFYPGTKMIATLACMQLVEQGKLSLDDPKALYKLCPEIEAAKVLQDGKLVDRKGDITLRMLLSHTAGYGYEFFNQRLADYGRAGGTGVKGTGYEVFSGDERDILTQPLVNQPGTAWEVSCPKACYWDCS